MPHAIIMNGRALDPKRAAQEMIHGVDTLLACANCDSKNVRAGIPKTIAQLPGEAKYFVPRQQDRNCEECGHRWTVTLPPEIYARTQIGK